MKLLLISSILICCSLCVEAQGYMQKQVKSNELIHTVALNYFDDIADIPSLTAPEHANFVDYTTVNDAPTLAQPIKSGMPFIHRVTKFTYTQKTNAYPPVQVSGVLAYQVTVDETGDSTITRSYNDIPLLIVIDSSL